MQAHLQSNTHRLVSLLPNKIQQDILKRHIGPFVFSFFTIMFLLLMQFLMLHIDKLVGKGIPFIVILELIITNLAYMVVLAAPMAVLVAAVVAYGDFSEKRELSALEAAGINPMRVMTPALVTTLLMCLFLVWFSNDVLPDANKKARTLFVDIRTQKPGFDLEPHTFYNGIEGYTFLVKRIDSETDSLYDVTLFQEPGSGRDRAVIKAEKGLLQMQSGGKLLTLLLHDGSIHRQISGQNTSDMSEKTRFDRYRISFDLSDLAFSRSNSNNDQRSDRTMSTRAMLAVVDSLRSQIQIEKDKFYHNISKIFPPSLQNAISKDSLTRRIKKDQSSEYEGSTTDTSTFIAFQEIAERSKRDQIISYSENTLEKFHSNYDNLDSNLEWKQRRINQYLVEVHKKFSIPFACIVFLLLGAPIGMLSRKGNLGFAALVSAGLLTFYWISIIQGEKLADRLYITPFWGMWFADLVLLAVGIILTLRLVTSFKLTNLWN